MSTTDDVIAIQQLLHRYCHHLDGGRVDAVVALFAPDAVLRPVYEGNASHSGRDAIRAWYTRYSERAAGAVRGLRHTISTPMIDVAGSRATSVCYLDADSVNVKTGARSLTGGRGVHSEDFSHYEEMPRDLEQKVIAEAKAKRGH